MSAVAITACEVKVSAADFQIVPTDTKKKIIKMAEKIYDEKKQINTATQQIKGGTGKNIDRQG